MDGDKQVFVKDLEIGQEAGSPFLVLSLTRGRTNRGGVYLNVDLGDRSGRIAGKVWDGAEAMAGRLAEGTVVDIRGYVDSFRGSPQFIIREAHPLSAQEIHWPDYLRASSRPEAEMRADLWRLINGLPDDDFRGLVAAILNAPQVAERFYVAPAAKSLHHAYLHGLLEHSLSVGRLAAGVADHYPNLNVSLLVAGAILHDVGKIWEFSPPPKSDYTTWGRHFGHLVMGAELIKEIAQSLVGFPGVKADLLRHLILSHHGEPEYGAPVRPQLLEAIVLHHLDNIDAKVEAVGSFIEAESDAEGWSSYHRLFNSHFRRTPEFPSPQSEAFEPEKPTGPAPDEESRADQEVALGRSGGPDVGRLF